MKKGALILVVLSIFVIISYLFIVASINKLQREQYRYPICGDDICESSEESYCLDCNLSCKSELCNSKLNVICDNCSVTQKELLPVFLQNQITAYDCLSDYYNYHPPRLIYHTVSNMNSPNEVCQKKEGCYISGGGFSEREGIKQDFITGLKEDGETEVTKEENVGFEIHELAHAFTYYGLGPVPSWFTEGISIYSESRLFCHPNQILSDKIDEIVPHNGYEKITHSNHVIGAMYFSILEQDYNCDKKCIVEILYSLHEYRENCIGDCFENAKKNTPHLMNLSLNNNDLRVPIITTKIIKQKSEEITGANLTSLFEILEIEY